MDLHKRYGCICRRKLHMQVKNFVQHETFVWYEFQAEVRFDSACVRFPW